MVPKIDVNVNSEVGKLEAVILHSPGKEVEDVTPQNAKRSLYSDILNLSVASQEYGEFRSVLEKMVPTFQVKNLLQDILTDDDLKERLINLICHTENTDSVRKNLLALPNENLAAQLIEGVPLVKDNLSRFLSQNRYSLQPLHNFFFTRDASIALNGTVLIACMASQVRKREALIMEAIFNHHQMFNANTVNPTHSPDFYPQITIEGGDILIAREDILLIGIGARTTTQGVDFILEHLKDKNVKKHIIVQELPPSPESFIHLDMVFTFLDGDCCLIYEPLIMDPNRFRTIHISLENGEVEFIREEKNIPQVLQNLGMELNVIRCGGNGNDWIQEREQWHSGANFFALAPGKVIGYGMNVYTIDALNKAGFHILRAKDILKEKVNPDDYKRYVITINGSELARGGGGCRCMTMPVRRAPIIL